VEAHPKDKVRVAGTITRYRTHQTKAGKTMAFAVLEDLQGEIELVIFPRTWAQVSSQMEIGKLVLVEGRIDPESPEAKLLVDTITTDLKLTSPVTSLPLPQAVPAPPDIELAEDGIEPAPSESELPVDTQDESSPGSNSVESQHAQPAEEVNERLADDAFYTPSPDAESGLQVNPDGELPPQPDIFPTDWEMANAVMAAVADPFGAIELAEELPEKDQPEYENSAIREIQPPPKGTTTEVISPAQNGEEIQLEVVQNLPAYILPPVPASDSQAVHMITVILRPSPDNVRDNLRIRQIYGTLIAFPGIDRFAFHVFERGRGYLIEFPNFTTRMCPELLSRLKSFIPEDQIRIEPITFQ
jgi:DNA polymerase-3 subunit alpha